MRLLLRSALLLPLFILVLLQHPGSYLFAEQNKGRRFALSLRSNVVKVKALWKNGTTHRGYGFFVGQDDYGSVIITANDTVRGNVPGEIAESVYLSFFDTPQESVKAGMLEVSDRRRNLAVLRTPTYMKSELKRDIVGCSSDVEADTKMWFFDNGGVWNVSKTGGVARSRFDKGTTILEYRGIASVVVPISPAVLDSGVVGIAFPVPGRSYANVLAISEVARAMWRWNLPWSLTRSLYMPCKGNKALPSWKECSGSRREVSWLIEELFQPGTSWETILETLGYLADEECIPYVFDIPSEEALENAQRYFAMLLGNLIYGAGTFLGAPWYEIENLECITPNPATRYDWVPGNFKLRHGLTACSFSVGGVAVSGLVFAQGRWYLLPSPRLILTIQQPK